MLFQECFEWSNNIMLVNIFTGLPDILPFVCICELGPNNEEFPYTFPSTFMHTYEAETGAFRI